MNIKWVSCNIGILTCYKIFNLIPKVLSVNGVVIPKNPLYLLLTKRNLKNASIPKPPPEGLCCGSGCQKCVWYIYAEELIHYYKDNGIELAKKELEKVKDPNIRAFLLMELKIKYKT